MRQIINGAIATCSFELMQILTLPRLMFSSALALFPPGMLFVILTVYQIEENEAFPFPLFIALIFTYLVCILSILLWATPNVYTELEAKSWIFNVCRPRGRISMFLGKYLASVVYSFIITMIATSLSAVIIQLSTESFQDPLAIWFNINVIFFCACAGYSAVFSLIGTVFYRRAMVVAAGFMIVSEAIMGNIPALVSRLTMRFHLQSLALHWFENVAPFPIEDVWAYYFLPSGTTYMYHLGCIGLIIAGALSVGCYIITTREYATSDET